MAFSTLGWGHFGILPPPPSGTCVGTQKIPERKAVTDNPPQNHIKASVRFLFDLRKLQCSLQRRAKLKTLQCRATSALLKHQSFITQHKWRREHSEPPLASLRFAFGVLAFGGLVNPTYGSARPVKETKINPKKNNP